MQKFSKSPSTSMPLKHSNHSAAAIRWPGRSRAAAEQGCIHHDHYRSLLWNVQVGITHIERNKFQAFGERYGDHLVDDTER